MSNSNNSLSTQSSFNERRITFILGRLRSLDAESQRLHQELSDVIRNGDQARHDADHTTVSHDMTNSQRSARPLSNRMGRITCGVHRPPSYVRGRRVIEVGELVIITNDFKGQRGTVGRVTHISDKRVTLIDNNRRIYTRSLDNVQLYECSRDY